MEELDLSRISEELGRIGDELAAIRRAAESLATEHGSVSFGWRLHGAEHTTWDELRGTP